MDVTLTATTGRTTGSRPSNRLRVEGKVPGVLYGLGKDPVSLTVDWRELRQALTTEASLNAIITLDVDGTKEISIVKELQRHPVRNDVIHVDFVRVDITQELLVEVPIVLQGEARKVQDEQGVVEQVLYTLPVYAKPDAIPNELTIDITGLEMGDAVRVGDLDLPAGSRTELDDDEVIAATSSTRAAIEEGEAEDAAAAEGVAGEAAEPEAAEGDEA
ncbi:MAG TPA: 50S ribosomal protein L25 [Acidimicrobiales bacterium]|nr:50S ribosomal protein L25 [Acidimicrobiales bacterium]